MQSTSFPKSQYLEARNLSWQVLIRNHVDHLPVSVSMICNNEAVKLIPYQKAENVIHLLGLEEESRHTDGFSFCYQGAYYILYQDNLRPQRQRYTIAHELGHCLLDHLSKQQAEPAMPTMYMERQSNRFAIQLLAPACVLWGLHVKSADEIAMLCNISAQAAGIRMERMEKLYAREQTMLRQKGKSCFLMVDLERQVYHNFEAFIRQTLKEKETVPPMADGKAPPKVPAPSDHQCG